MNKIFKKIFTKNFILYAIIGVSGVTLDFVIFAFLTKVVALDPLVANVISTTFGITNNFVLNAFFNFKKRDALLYRFISFYAVGVVGIVLSTLILRALHDGLGLDPLIAKFVSLIFVLIAQYSLNKKISFRNISEKISFKQVVFSVKPYLLDIALGLGLIGSYLLASPYLPSTDEVANILESKLIVNGNLPYADFFTHHMPGIYLLSVPIYLLSLDNVFTFRLIFGLIITAWAFINGQLLKRYVSKLAFVLYMLLYSLGIVVFWGHLGLAESVIVCAFATVFILFFNSYRHDSPISFRQFVVMSLLIAFIAMLAVSYIFLCIVAYLLLAERMLSKNKYRSKEILQLGLIVIGPYMLLGLVVLITGSLRVFIFDNLTFNSEYYSRFYKQIGDSPPEVFISSITLSIQAIANLISQPYVPAITLLLSYVVLAFIIFRNYSKLFALFTLSLLFLLNPRGDAFGPHGISSHFNQVNQHSTVYHMTALLFLALVCAYLWTAHHSRSKQTARQIIAALLLVIVVLALVRTTLQIYNETYRKYPQSNLYSRQYLLPYPYVQTINALLVESDSAWVGPFDFESQLFLKPRVAAAYTFYAPWHSACKECTDDFVNDLRYQRPKIVYWEEKFAIAGKSADEYAPSVKRLLRNEYFTVADPRLDNFYFNSLYEAELSKKLINKGYVIE